ncbi:MAG: CBS domain-containing protein, partial [Lachnospiraceae bacterium]|nr:CBS domain-containing protein [Lachnospiraceae bacterium]
ACERAIMPVRKLKEILRKPMYVPETKNIDDLLKSMQASKTQMAIVLDEYGQTAGLVTIEDILEEIVGNILDEYDEDEAYIEETAKKDEFLIDGKTPLEELEEKFDLSFDDLDVETVNGFVISKLEHIPEDDEEFEFDEGDYHFKVMSVKNHMVQSVLVTKKTSESNDGGVK